MLAECRPSWYLQRNPNARPGFAGPGGCINTRAGRGAWKARCSPQTPSLNSMRHSTLNQIMRYGIKEGSDVHIDHPVELPTVFPCHCHRIDRRTAREPYESGWNTASTSGSRTILDADRSQGPSLQHMSPGSITTSGDGGFTVKVQQGVCQIPSLKAPWLLSGRNLTAQTTVHSRHDAKGPLTPALSASELFFEVLIR